MKRCKKTAVALFAAFCLSLFSGCLYLPPEPPQDFDAFIESLPQELIKDSDYSLNLLYENPEAAGFSQEVLYELPFTSIEEYKESLSEDDLLEQLESFSYNSLTEKQKLTYDILKDYLTRMDIPEELVPLDNNYLGSFTGFQAELPLLLNEYKIRTQHDLDSYFHMLDTSKETFKNYYENELERQKLGVGLSKSSLEGAIEQAENFSSDENCFLIETTNAKIDQATFLNEEEKAEAKEKNAQSVSTLLEAYAQLAEDLSTIGTDRDGGLCTLENGKEYYAYLLKADASVDMTPEELSEYLQKQKNKYLQEFLQYISEHPEIQDSLLNFDRNNVQYCDFETAEENMDYLQSIIPGRFPELPDLHYQVIQVPESMAENFSPAAYVSAPIDAGSDVTQSIYLNGEYSQSLFSTIAHEGYPGHMYQYSYFRSLDLPDIHSLVNYTGYTEGWAVYVEQQILDEIPAGSDMPRFLWYNDMIMNICLCQADLGIHYEGWSRENLLTFLNQEFSGISQESSDEIYDLIVENPVYYQHYFLAGMLFMDLREETENAMGRNFDEVAYHQAILSCGPAPLSYVEKQVEAYMQNAESRDKTAA